MDTASITDAFAYALPPELIAQSPAVPRDSARLLVADGDAVREDVFRNIGDWLPPRSVLVLNDTKVLPARMILRKPTGGIVQALCVRWGDGEIAVLANRRLSPGMVLRLDGRRTLTALRQEEQMWILRPSFPLRTLPAILHRHGRMPLPPYIRSPLSERRLRDAYQSVIASQEGSVAAPTALLHFTKRLLRSLERRGITILRVTLHVGLGTFAPLTDEHLRTGTLHEERYAIDARTARALAAARRAGRPIIAVGTTVVRTLESACDTRGRIVRPHGTTRLFIREGYRFRLVDGLITNFHVPRSSLLMLVAALAGREKLLRLYRWAIRRRFRFFSFGDAMLLLPANKPDAVRPA